MSNPTPLQSFLGGVGLAIPIQFQLVLNGSVFGISGFLRDAVRGKMEALASVSGFLLGGIVIGAMEGIGPDIGSIGLRYIAVSGLLVGIGTKASGFYIYIFFRCHNSHHPDVLWLYFRVSIGHIT
jgi:hypothetical protein